jgi:hypothetical protein
LTTSGGPIAWDSALKPARVMLVAAFCVCFVFNAGVISIGRIWPTAPDAAHTYPLQLKGWGVHYLPTTVGDVFHWTGRLNIVLFAAALPFAALEAARKRRAEDETLKRLTSGGFRPSSSNSPQGP